MKSIPMSKKTGANTLHIVLRNNYTPYNGENQLL